LTLLKSSIRKVPSLGDTPYARENADDDRFTDHHGSLQSIVTSSAQNDAGLFETNLRDERYLPFENSGVVSEWQLELPADPSNGDARQFDYQTISDVILHIRYTAREGGALLRRESVENLKTAIAKAEAAGSVRLFSVRDEFPTEWAKFQGQVPLDNHRFELALSLSEEHYPFWSQGRLKKVLQLDLYALSTRQPPPGSLAVFDKADQADPTASEDALARDAALGNLYVGKLTEIAVPSRPVSELKLYFEDNEIADLWLAVTWAGEQD
jgi:hypothetical protein